MADSKAKTEENLLFKQAFNTPELMSLKARLSGSGRGFCALNGLLSSQRANFFYSIGSDIDKKLIILQNEQVARAVFDEFRFFDRKSRFYPAKDFLFYSADIKSNELTSERIRVIRDVLFSDKITVFTTIEALLGRLPSVKAFKENEIVFKEGEELDLEKTARKLSDMGYLRSAMVTFPGEFSVRGGIIDVFPLTEVLPYRIELWDKEIDNIRRFDADTQKSVEKRELARIFPATEEGFFGKYKEDSLLCDYFGEGGVVFIDDPKHAEEAAKLSYTEFEDAMKGRISSGMAKEDDKNLLAEPKEVFKALEKMKGLALTGFSDVKLPISVKETFTVLNSPVMTFNNSVPLLKREILRYKRLGHSVVICGQSKTRQTRLYEGLREDGVDCYYSENLNQVPGKAQVLITVAGILKGAEFPEAGIVYISENDIFGGTYQRKKKKAYKRGDAITSFRDLSVGDYVVHENYGVGIYRGIEKIEQDRVLKDFLKISYAGTDNLYVPVSQLDIISKYSGGEAKVKLSSLSSGEWKRTKDRVKSDVSEMAKELVSLYALRQQDRGYACGPDTTWQREFEETFPFEETRGQLQAIEEVKADLCSTKIMDRLICGDVGFGKTEVALRAAFKVVQEGRQVLVLVPTTVLAKQHYNTFSARLRDYPVKVGMLSRFRTTAQNKETVAAVKNGEIDIVIGTHRALSKDVEFKNLGLLVIDEEQRFGVKHKETIKQMRKEVDVLSLTATPIPRTLHMSLIGIRDMSLLDEAPLERLPVQTFVFEYNEEMVREAIERELARGGQVYYVCNRIRQIPDIAAKLSELVPSANIVYAHGRMPETKLEDIMSDFVDKEIDVLVATTIIEIGLDISNVNTIIIHDSDNLGLSQLYQLRGRVGRGSRTAYAFLMYRRDKLLKEVAEKRLTAIREFTDLGSGFKIAMRDLEIRGAGNLLGPEQHGNMEAVGYDLYCKLLGNALKTEKGEEVMQDFETAVDIMEDAYIPESFIPDEAQKLEVYKKIALITNDEAEEEMVDELIDRFGEPPAQVMKLIKVARLRDLAHRTYITKIFQAENVVKIDVFPKAKLNPAAIPEFVAARSGITFDASSLAPSFKAIIPDYKKGISIVPYLTGLIEDMSMSLAE